MRAIREVYKDLADNLCKRLVYAIVLLMIYQIKYDTHEKAYTCVTLQLLNFLFAIIAQSDMQGIMRYVLLARIDQILFLITVSSFVALRCYFCRTLMI